MEWINVDKQLPEDGTRCLICSEGLWHEAHYRDGEFFIDDAFGEPFATDATHWAIPNPPSQ